MISKLNESLARIDKNTGEIQALKVENDMLKNKVNVLDEKLIRFDQYS